MDIDGVHIERCHFDAVVIRNKRVTHTYTTFTSTLSLYSVHCTDDVCVLRWPTIASR